MKKDSIRNIITFKLHSEGLLKNKKFIFWGLFLVVFLSLTIILAWKYFPAQIYKEGVVAPRDILASRTFEVENEEATREAQVKAINEVVPVYKIDAFIVGQMETELKTEFSIINELQIASLSQDQLKAKELKSQLPIVISDASLKAFIQAPSEMRPQMEIYTRDLISRAMKDGIKENENELLRKARQKIREDAEKINLPSAQKEAVADIAAASIRPNSHIDMEETAKKQQERRESVKPVMTTIKKGQIIVNKGEIITPEHIRILEEMGLQRKSFNYTGIAGIAILTLLLILLLENYIRQSLPELLESPSHLLLLIIIIIGVMTLCSLFVQFNPYWAPVPIAAILIAVLIDHRISIMITTFLSILIGIMTGEMQFAAAALITGFASILTVWRVHSRLDLITASVIIFFVNEVCVTVFSLIQNTTQELLIENLVYGGINGFSSGIIAIGILPLLEYGFNITTGMKLLELTNQSEPLMKRLLMEAPGTYHHSVIVGNLAEAGAQAVGEDPVLCRAAAYYHDIGKLKRSYFFIENQLGSENPHEKLSPNLSALIIMSHVKDGIELGQEHHLPQPVLDIIGQHHGNSIVSYFYHMAKQSDKDMPVEQDFRYPSSKPQSKAAAIVMLADSVEAAARTLPVHTPQKIEGLVKSIFKKVIDDGQLDDCPISLKDINELVNTFTRILTGIYHHRIEYPDQIIEQVQADSFPGSKVTPINLKAR